MNQKHLETLCVAGIRPMLAYAVAASHPDAPDDLISCIPLLARQEAFAKDRINGDELRKLLQPTAAGHRLRAKSLKELATHEV